MLTSFNQSYGTFIFAKNTDDSAKPVAKLIDFVINPDTGIFEALWVQHKGTLQILPLSEISSWEVGEILISDSSEILPPSALPKIEKILSKECAILKSPVLESESLVFLGNVSDFAFDTISPRILSLIVKKGFWPFSRTRIFPHTQINKITPSGIFILNQKSKIKVKKVFDTPIKNNLPEMECNPPKPHKNSTPKNF